LIFELSPHDMMPVDDVAYGRVPAGDKLPVYLAPADASPWIRRAIASDPMVDLRAGELGAEPVGLDTLVVVDGACPANPPGGDLLMLRPPPGPCLGTTVGEAIERPSITSWETGDPRLRFLTLDGVHVQKARRLAPLSASQELVRTDAGAIVTDASSGSRTATLVGFDVGDTDWPLKASFVLFVRNVLEQARAHRANGVTGPARTGEPLRVNVPASADHVEAVGPDEKPVEVSVRSGLAVVPTVGRAGLYRIDWKGPDAGSIVVPANLTSAAESDLAVKPLPADGPKVSVSDATGPAGHTEWTWIVALAALGLVVADVAYMTRRPSAKSAPPGADKPRLPERRAR
jgi:hypothetical protein